MQSENFSVYSALSEKKTRKLLLHLEALRGVFVFGMDSASRLEEKPTKILLLGKESDYRKLGLPERTAGIFISDLRENYIVVSNSLDMDESHVILHEYVHFIVGTTQRFPYPTWWSEGFAEYASASTLRKGQFAYGLVQEGRLANIHNSSWISWEVLLEASSTFGLGKHESALFYAQSWLLVHFLHNRVGDYPPIQVSWSDYLQRLESGQNRSTAFEDAFSIDLTTLTQTMKKYANGGRYSYARVDIDTLVPHFSPQSTSMSQIEIQMELGRFSLRTQEADSAASWFSKVIAADSKNAQAISGLASALALGEDFDGAERHFEIALSMEPDNPYILLDFALFKLQQASAPDAWFTSSDKLATAEKLLLEARAIMGGTVEIDTYLASIWQHEDGASASALKLLETVIFRAPTEQWPMLMIAEGLQQVGQLDDAITIAKLIIQYDHGGSIYSIRAQRLIDDIQSPPAPEPKPAD